MRRVLAFLLVAGLAGPAGACINDVELPSHEREFRSSYMVASSNAPPKPTQMSGRRLRGELFVVGAAALLCGIVMASKGGNRAGS